MARSVILRARAEDDIRNIVEWYESERVGLGADFLSRLRATLEAVRLHPESSPLVHKNVRRAIVGKFPYLVFYVSEVARVVILAVLHSSRNPSVWPRR